MQNGRVIGPLRLPERGRRSYNIIAGHHSFSPIRRIAIKSHWMRISLAVETSRATSQITANLRVFFTVKCRRIGYASSEIGS